ncbi:MAG: sigma-70 family RNA polymerase sigma factor [Bacteroidales bacterium]|nr:sigma-70 family RNA polymerase sigma factor [Bacteroidales bacterium]
MKKIDPNTISEKVLIKKCIANKREYQEILYRRYADKMFNVCLIYVGNESDAGDILQEGFITVFRNLNKFRFEGSFEGWVRRIIINTALKFLNKKNKEIEKVKKYQKIKEFAIDIIIDTINAKQIIELINDLPLRAATVLKLYAIEGYKHREIASLLNITEGTSKSQLNRARFLLKESMNKLNV